MASGHADRAVQFARVQSTMTKPVTQTPPRVFVSHSTRDKERFVLGFARRLRDNGVDAWVDQWEMNPGDSLVDKIFEEGLKESTAIVVVVSENTAESQWVLEELNAAFVKRIESQTRLIPVRLDRCKMPECLKTSIWQDISDLANYDQEFRRILNAIFGQYDKPPIGEPPPYITNPVPKFDGVAPLDGVILEAICQIAIENGWPSADGDQLVERLKESGVTEGEIIEAQEVLEAHRLVEVQRSFSPKPKVGFTVITPAGFDLFAQRCISDYDKLCTDVARELVRDRTASNRTVAQGLTLPIRVVDHILQSLEYKGLIKYAESLGGGLIRDVYWVSPELCRQFGTN